MRNPEGHHFVTLEMYSFAVVNGRSEFQIRMMTNQGEYLYFSGPLLTAFGSEPMELLLRRNPEYSDASSKAWRRQGGGFLTGMIDSARLIFNNGRGGLTINLVLSDNQTQDPVNFELTFNRNAPPILDLTQDSIYFTP
jgi:hypothetical protein